MKTLSQKSKREEGTVLFVMLIICAILAILIGSYLSLIQTQRSSVSRAQCWNSALAVAEAGIEEGMAHINSGVSTNNLATNTWTSQGSGIVCKTNYLGDSYYMVTIKTSPAVTDAFPVILSSSYVPGPISGPALGRTILVNTKAKTPSGGGKGAIVTQGDIDLSGTGVTVDSFDSSNPTYSTGGQYDPTKAEAHGDVYSTSTDTNAMSIMDSAIYGTVHTVPGVQPILDPKVNGTGRVGDLSWLNAGNLGIESGHAVQDASYTFNDVTLPSLAWLQPVALKGGNQLKTNGISFPYVLGNLSPWEITDLAQSLYITDPNTIVYVPNSLTIGSGQEIFVAPGASLTLYVGAANATIGGQGIVNASGLAADFQYKGLPSNTAVGLSGNGSMTAQIYAPEAYITLSGGGSTTNDFSGQIVGGSFKMNGHFKVHYDESLTGASSAFAGYAAAFWTEQ
jgi:hypothetical protein